MTLREISNLTGVGTLLADGRRMATVVYEIRIMREFQQARGQQLDDAEDYIVGQVLTSDPKDLSGLMGRALILKLAEHDGRAWKCRLGADDQLQSADVQGLRSARELIKEDG